jgi:hypothetical protein
LDDFDGVLEGDAASGSGVLGDEVALLQIVLLLFAIQKLCVELRVLLGIADIEMLAERATASRLSRR